MQTLALRSAAFLTAGLWQVRALAANADFLGPTPNTGGPEGTDAESIRQVILDLLQTILRFMALLAVIFVVIAGIRYIVSQGDDTQKEKATKTIIYAIVGLIVIILANVIVAFIIGLFAEV